MSKNEYTRSTYEFTISKEARALLGVAVSDSLKDILARGVKSLWMEANEGFEDMHEEETYVFMISDIKYYDFTNIITITTLDLRGTPPEKRSMAITLETIMELKSME